MQTHARSLAEFGRKLAPYVTRAIKADRVWRVQDSALVTCSQEAIRATAATSSPPSRPQCPICGTEVLLGDGLVEIHVGRGIWQTVAASGA
jgi:hypothetical protein